MNLIKRIKNDIRTDPDKSKTKQFLAKVFGIIKNKEENKSMDHSEIAIDSERSVNVLGTVHKDVTAIKTLQLDLSGVVKGMVGFLFRQNIKV